MHVKGAPSMAYMCVLKQTLDCTTNKSLIRKQETSKLFLIRKKFNPLRFIGLRLEGFNEVWYEKNKSRFEVKV